jgi:uncharacterized membrane protein HdeD (DUF308 family)
MASELKQSPRRDFPGRRWLGVALRGVHLVTVILLGAAIFGATRYDAGQMGIAVLITGAVLWALDIWSKPQHLREWAGVSMIIKLALVAAMVFLPTLHEPLFWVIVAWSAVFSHAPASFRNAPVFGR